MSAVKGHLIEESEFMEELRADVPVLVTTVEHNDSPGLTETLAQPHASESGSGSDAETRDHTMPIHEGHEPISTEVIEPAESLHMSNSETILLKYEDTRSGSGTSEETKGQGTSLEYTELININPEETLKDDEVVSNTNGKSEDCSETEENTKLIGTLSIEESKPLQSENVTSDTQECEESKHAGTIPESDGMSSCSDEEAGSGTPEIDIAAHLPMDAEEEKDADASHEIESMSPLNLDTSESTTLATSDIPASPEAEKPKAIESTECFNIELSWMEPQETNAPASISGDSDEDIESEDVEKSNNDSANFATSSIELDCVSDEASVENDLTNANKTDDTLMTEPAELLRPTTVEVSVSSKAPEESIENFLSVVEAGRPSLSELLNAKLTEDEKLSGRIGSCSDIPERDSNFISIPVPFPDAYDMISDDEVSSILDIPKEALFGFPIFEDISSPSEDFDDATMGNGTEEEDEEAEIVSRKKETSTNELSIGARSLSRVQDLESSSNSSTISQVSNSQKEENSSTAQVPLNPLYSVPNEEDKDEDAVDLSPSFLTKNETRNRSEPTSPIATQVKDDDGVTQPIAAEETCQPEIPTEVEIKEEAEDTFTTSNHEEEQSLKTSPEERTVNFIYSNPNDVSFTQPTPDVDGANLRIVYMAAAAQATNSDEETGTPQNVRLLYPDHVKPDSDENQTNQNEPNLSIVTQTPVDLYCDVPEANQGDEVDSGPVTFLTENENQAQDKQNSTITNQTPIDLPCNVPGREDNVEDAVDLGSSMLSIETGRHGHVEPSTPIVAEAPSDVFHNVPAQEKKVADEVCLCPSTFFAESEPSSPSTSQVPLNPLYSVPNEEDKDEDAVDLSPSFLTKNETRNRSEPTSPIATQVKNNDEVTQPIAAEETRQPEISTNVQIKEDAEDTFTTSNHEEEQSLKTSPKERTVNFIYSNPNDVSFTQPTPDVDDTNLRIVYVAAAAQAKNKDEETGTPPNVRLLYPDHVKPDSDENQKNQNEPNLSIVTQTPVDLYCDVPEANPGDEVDSGPVTFLTENENQAQDKQNSTITNQTPIDLPCNVSGREDNVEDAVDLSPLFLTKNETRIRSEPTSPIATQVRDNDGVTQPIAAEETRQPEIPTEVQIKEEPEDTFTTSNLEEGQSLKTSPKKRTVHFIYSNPNDLSFTQPAPDVDDSNLRIVYVAAAAQAEDSDEETGTPRKVRLLYAEALGFGGNGVDPPQFVYTSTTPNQCILSEDQSIYAIQPRFVTPPTDYDFNPERVRAMFAHQPPTNTTPLPMQVVTHSSGSSFTQSLANFPETSNIMAGAGNLPNLLPPAQTEQRIEITNVFANHGFYNDSVRIKMHAPATDSHMNNYQDSYSVASNGIHMLATASELYEAERLGKLRAQVKKN